MNPKKYQEENLEHFLPKTRRFEAFGKTKIFYAYSANANVDIGSRNEDDLFLSFRGLLILGRFLGVIPISGVFSKSYKNLQTNFWSVPGITSGICIFLLTLNLGLAITKFFYEEKTSILTIVKSMKLPLFAGNGLFIYVYFIIRRHEFVKIFKLWAVMSRNLKFTEKDKHLKTTVIIISVIMFSSTFLEIAIHHLEYFEVFDDFNGYNAKWGKQEGHVSAFQTYYWRSNICHYWNRYLGYHPILPVVAFFIHKFILYGGNYIEVMSALFFRAMYYQFKTLCKVAKSKLPIAPTILDQMNGIKPSNGNRESWDELATEHDTLCEVLDIMNDFFSPIVFVCYANNIFFFSVQLLFAMNPDTVNQSIVHSIYSPWSFVHIVLRMFIFSLFASKINEYAHKIRDVVSKCPPELCSKRVSKLDKKVNFGPKLGITGLDCFVVTKPFMLNILNVFFTVEIVLLQGLASEQQEQQDQCQCQPIPVNH